MSDDDRAISMDEFRRRITAEAPEGVPAKIEAIVEEYGGRVGNESLAGAYSRILGLTSRELKQLLEERSKQQQ